MLRTRSQRLPGLSTAESEPFEPLDSTIQESAESAFVSRDCVAGSSHARSRPTVSGKMLLSFRWHYYTRLAETSVRQARPRSGADHDLACRTRPAIATTVAGREFCQRLSSPAGLTVLMGNRLAKVLTKFSLELFPGSGCHGHAMRFRLTYETHMRSLGIQALEGARMKLFLRSG